MKEKPQQLNKLCRRCVRACKQLEEMRLLRCPQFKRRSYDPEDLKFEQLDLFDR